MGNEEPEKEVIPEAPQEETTESQPAQQEADNQPSGDDNAQEAQEATANSSANENDGDQD